MTRPMLGPPDTHHVFYSFPHTHPDDALGGCPKCFVDSRGERESVAKRLTDAECAAERWHFAAVWMAGLGLLVNDSDRRREHFADTWERFAAYPHAFKETPDE